MISKTTLLTNLKLRIGPKLMSILSNDFIDEVLYMRTLPRFSDWYPQLYDIKLTADDAIPMRGYSGRITNFGAYRIPNQFDVPWVDSRERFHWRDLEDYRISGNDLTDIYNGGNFLMRSMFLNTMSLVPHTRSYFLVTFQEPDLILVDPPQNAHRDFNIVMQADRTLKTIPRNMERFFIDYFVAQMKSAIYIDRQYDSGTQTFNGVEIDTKLEDLREGDNEIKDLEDIFEKDYYKNPERFQTICLYQYKN